jgi:hypothetical protein
MIPQDLKNVGRNPVCGKHQRCAVCLEKGGDSPDELFRWLRMVAFQLAEIRVADPKFGRKSLYP